MIEITSIISKMVVKYGNFPYEREAPRPQAELPGHAVANRMRAKEISFLIVPLDPVYKAGLTEDLPVNLPRFIVMF